MTLNEVLNEFLREQIVNGSTEDTINHYLHQIRHFINYIGDIDIQLINYNIYQEYILYLRRKDKIYLHKNSNNEKLSSITIRTYARALKTYFNFAYRNNYIRIPLGTQITIPKATKKVIYILEDYQIQEIISCYDKKTFLGARNLLIISLMLDCGLRVSEVKKLCLNDFFFEKNIIRVNGKGQKQRYVPLSDATYSYLLCYLNFVKLSDNDILIIDRFGKPITINAIKQIFKRLKYKLGYKDLHPHLLRHTFATLFIVNGGNPMSLKIILGHTTLTMVENYVHLANTIHIAQNKKYAPLSNI